LVERRAEKKRRRELKAKTPNFDLRCDRGKSKEGGGGEM